MKALSLSQPWAWSILSASKRIENRDDARGMPPMCKHRGPLLLHAAKRMTRDDYDDAVDFMVSRGLAWPPSARLKPLAAPAASLPIVPSRIQDAMLPRGMIVGRCDVVGHVEPQQNGWPRIVLGEGTAVESHLRPDRVLVSCAEMHRGVAETVALGSALDLRWWAGGYALVFAAVEQTPWVPCRGSLGLWDVPAEVLEKLREDVVIFADFNARTSDDRVRLDTVGSRASLIDHEVRPGDWVWLSDGEVRVRALVEHEDGKLFARVAWETTRKVAT